MAVGSDLLNLGLSGLLAAQRALSTTSHNISNVNTAGYSRQEVLLGTRPPVALGEHFLGTGVDINSIRRSYDQFLTAEVRTSTATTSEVRVQQEFAAQLDNLFGDADTGLSPLIQDFFNGIQDAADDPTSLPIRQLVIDQAGALAGRFETLDRRLDQVHAGIQTRVSGAVNEINDLAESIASLNQEIMSLGAVEGEPNDLLDQRDALLTQLAEQVSVTAVAQDDGALNVFIGTGQPLVMGNSAQRLAVGQRPDDPSATDILLVSPTRGSVAVTPAINGGVLGGLLDFEGGMLADAQRSLDTLALGIAEQVNTQHQLGVDLRGDLGGLFFGDQNAPALREQRASAHSDNTGSASLAITVDSVGKLANSDYRLTYDGTQYSLIRQQDKSLLGSFAGLPQSFPDEGFTVELAAGALNPGDSFHIRPTAGAASELQVALTDPRSIALASPIRTAASTDNLGDATISAGGVAGLSGTPLGADITLTYDASTSAFAVSAPPGGAIAYDPAVDGGTELALNVPGFGDISFAISGIPADGDAFSLAHNAGGVSDNRNALALADLQSQRFLSDGNATLQEGYTQLVTDVGSRTRSLELASVAQEKILTRAQDARDAQAGVNLDQEAADLLRFQQAYQAAAEVISVSNQLFQTLMGAVGR